MSDKKPGYEKRIKHRKIKIGDIPPSHKQGRSFDIEVEAEERQFIAERLKLPSLQKLRVTGTVKQLPDVPIYRLEALVSAEMTLLCTVSLEEFSDTLEEAMQWDFSRDRRYKPTATQMESPNHPEYIEQDAIDPIEYAVQTLGLAISAYPRRQGADLSDWQKHSATAALIRKGWLIFGGDKAHPQKANNGNGNAAFAALAELKRKMSS